MSVLPAMGGSPRVFYSSATDRVLTARAISASTLLILIQNDALSGGNGGRKGLWKMNTDSSSLTHLMSMGPTEPVYLNDSS